jgi:hypothetical protein
MVMDRPAVSDDEAPDSGGRVVAASPRTSLPPGMAPAETTEAVRPEPEIQIVEKERVVVKEVVSKELEDKARALEEYNRSITEQRNRLGEELEQRNDAIRFVAFPPLTPGS